MVKNMDVLSISKSLFCLFEKKKWIQLHKQKDKDTVLPYQV